jgi:hypothetical protein
VFWDKDESAVFKLATHLMNTICAQDEVPDAHVIAGACLSVVVTVAAAYPAKVFGQMRDGAIEALSNALNSVEEERRREMN